MFKILYNKMLKDDIAVFYLGIIRESISQAGLQCEYVDSIRDLHSEDIIITTNVIDAIKVHFLLNRPFVNWYQGIIPEESFTRRKSKLRKTIYEILEKATLKSCILNIFVSDSMLSHYRSKYGYAKDNHVIVPCFSTNINKSCFFTEGKYRNLTFAYVGGLSKWQCIDKVLTLYKHIENMNPSSRLKILTNEVDKASSLLKDYGITNYNVKYVKNEDLKYELNDVKYGFILREESPVNYVATPTKMSVYLANGVIPVFTDSIGDFQKVFGSINHKILLNSKSSEIYMAKQVLTFNGGIVDVNSILSEYESVFESYYSRSLYIDKLKGIFTQLSAKYVEL